MLDRLAAAQRKQRAFVADAAHELRSPLASMRTQLEVAAAARRGRRACPAELLPDVHRLTALVEDLLVLARSGTGRRATEARAARPRRRSSPTSSGRYAAARVPVRVRTAPAASAARRSVAGSWPRDDVTRALANLVDNAVRHARRPSSSAPWTSRRRTPGSSSATTATAYRDEDRERVFDRFARLDEARDRDTGGSGLGLAITRELLRRNGGHVRLEDAAPGLRAVVQFERLAD